MPPLIQYVNAFFLFFSYCVTIFDGDGFAYGAPRATRGMKKRRKKC